jgi:AcrR family transcriptional regulator
MPREALDTKEKLIRSGEHLFARQGVDGALTRDIVSHAGQAHDSAVHYHFGSREGLLAAILDKHIQRMEKTRRPALAGLGSSPRLATLVHRIVEPVADELRSEDGRDFLRIIAQLAGRARAGTEPVPLRGTALADQLGLLERACRAKLPQPLAIERIALMTTMLTAALADRARHIDAKRRLVLDHDDYVTNLIAMLTAALRAPA